MVIHTKKVSIHNTKDSHQTTQEESEENIYQKQSKTINKMAVRTHILIIILNINGINAPTKDIDWLNGYKSRTHIYAAYKRST